VSSRKVIRVFPLRPEIGYDFRWQRFQDISLDYHLALIETQRTAASLLGERYKPGHRFAALGNDDFFSGLYGRNEPR
jgi:hypothetical protein